MEAMLKGHAPGVAVPVVGCIIVALVQGALAVRASVLCGTRRKRILFLSVVGFLVIGSLIAGAGMVVANTILVS